MTPEQKREQWLKRALPALAVLVVYFVLISGFITEKSKKAHEQYLSLSQKGIDAAVLSGIAQDQTSINNEITALEQTDKTIHATLAANSGFLAKTDSANTAIEQISVILAKHHLEVLNEQRTDKPDIATLPRSLRDTEHWLKDILAADAPPPATTATTPQPTVPPQPNKTESPLNIWTIHYVGNYLDNYHALSEIFDSNIKALPVSLTMKAYKTANEQSRGEREWVLMLWL